MKVKLLFLEIILFFICCAGAQVLNRVTDFPENELCPKLSPNGQFLAFSRINLAMSPQTAHICVTDYAGNMPVVITSRGTDNQNPSWFSSNTQIAYEKLVPVAGGYSNFQIWIVSQGANDGQLLMQNNWDFSIMADVSPQNDVVFVTGGNMPGLPFSAPIMRYCTSPVPLSGTSQTFFIAICRPSLNLTMNTGIVGLYPQWDPMGTKIAYSAWNQVTGWDIYISQYNQVSSGLSAPQRITSDPGDEFQPTWSPDGQWIAYVYAGQSGSVSANIFLVNVNNGSKIQGTFEKSMVVTPDWHKISTGEEYIYCAANIDGDFDIYRFKPKMEETMPTSATYCKIQVLNTGTQAGFAAGITATLRSFLENTYKNIQVEFVSPENSPNTHNCAVYYESAHYQNLANYVAAYLSGYFVNLLPVTCTTFAIVPGLPPYIGPGKANIVVEVY